MVDFFKNNRVNLVIISVFVFSLSKLITIFAYIPFLYELLLTGFFLSLIVPYSYLNNKKFLSYIEFIMSCAFVVATNIIFHSFYNYSLLLSHIEISYIALFGFLAVSVIPASIFFVLYLGLKQLMTMEYE